MKQSLTLKLGQHLTMTPQLQQAIRLLQLSTLELRQEIQLAVETNPLLELVEQLFEAGVAGCLCRAVSEFENCEDVVGDAELAENARLLRASTDRWMPGVHPDMR